MRPEFLRDGKFSRSAVVTEVRARRLSGDAIRELADDSEMQAEFFGDFSTYVRPKKTWDEAYLEQLSCVASEECFSLAYLLYLDEVADYVGKAGYRKARTFCAVGLMLIVVGVILWMIAKTWMNN